MLNNELNTMRRQINEDINNLDNNDMKIQYRDLMKKIETSNISGWYNESSRPEQEVLTTPVTPTYTSPFFPNIPQQEYWTPNTTSKSTQDVDWGTVTKNTGMVLGGIGLLVGGIGLGIMGIKALLDDDIHITDALLDSIDGGDLNGYSFL